MGIKSTAYMLNKTHLEGAAAAVHMALVVGSRAENRPAEYAFPDLRRNDQAVLLARDGVAHEDLCLAPVHGEEATVAAP